MKEGTEEGKSCALHGEMTGSVEFAKNVSLIG